jgi:hypothetical protein
MKPVTTPPSQPTIRFKAAVGRLEKSGPDPAIPLPKSMKLPAGEKVMIEATINGFPLRIAAQPDGPRGHCLKVNQAMLAAARVAPGATVSVEITRIGDEPATRMPADLRQALAAAPRAAARWASITPNARQNWILWLSSGKLEETRRTRIQTACDMLGAGKPRVCCFGGLGWLRKDHPTAGDSWRPL